MTPPIFAHGSLRLYLLSLLAECPQHGYELIQALTDRFGGTYSPSAGTIYPRLAKLEEEGLVTKTADGRKTVYAITDAGRAELEARRGELDAIEDEVTDSVRRLAFEVRSEVNEAMRSLRAELANAARAAKDDARRPHRAAAGGAGAGGAAAGADSADAGEGWDDVRITSRLALREIDLVLSEFRQQLRSDLRSHVAGGGSVDARAAAELRARLSDVGAEALRSLR